MYTGDQATVLVLHTGWRWRRAGTMAKTVAAFRSGVPAEDVLCPAGWHIAKQTAGRKSQTGAHTVPKLDCIPRIHTELRLQNRPRYRAPL